MNTMEFRNRLLAANITLEEELLGCSSSEIQQLEDSVGYKLPESYVEFLEVAGHGLGGFMREVDMKFNDLPNLKQIATDILEDCEDGRLQLPENAIVFSCRYGEQFMFFLLGVEVSDDDVYYYSEYDQERQFRRIGTFLEVLRAELEEAEKLERNHPGIHARWR